MLAAGEVEPVAREPGQGAAAEQGAPGAPTENPRLVRGAQAPGQASSYQPFTFLH